MSPGKGIRFLKKTFQKKAITKTKKTNIYLNK